MPTSDDRGKKEALAWIASTFPREAKILDVGPGAGFWGWELSRLGFVHVDAVEVWGPYVELFNLRKVYQEVFVADVRYFSLLGIYDLVIFGDVLEHLSRADAKEVLGRATADESYALVSVPWMYPQGPHEGNPWEAHLQPDLTPEIARAEFSAQDFLFCDELIGVFVLRGDQPP
jgi:hypothetical protein